MPEAKRIVVTGATGLIGGKIVQSLVGRGDEVVALVREVEKARRKLPPEVKLLQWSTSSADGEWVTAIDGAYGVIHLAGAPVAGRWSSEWKRKIRETRISGTRNMVEAISRAATKPEVLVGASAVGYYGTSPDATFSEDAPVGSDFLASVCGEWESETKRAEALGVRVVRVRTGIVLDPNEGALSKLLLPFRLFVGGPIASGRQWFPWIHIQDEVGIFLWGLDNPEVSGAVNAAAPGIMNNRDFSKQLGKALHRPSLLPTPAFVFRALFGEGSMILTEGQKVIPTRTLELGYRFLHPTLDEALGSLLR
jgi:uncharacterized protein (TIGR01777 family)